MSEMARTPKLLCLPVKRVVDRFVRDDTRPDGIDELSEFSIMEDYFAECYREIIGNVEWKGFTFETKIFIPRDADDIAYALVTDSPHEAEKDENRAFPQIQNRIANWVYDNLEYGEIGPLTSPTRLRTEFVEPEFEVWHHSSGPTGEHLRWRDTLDRGRLVLLGGPGSGKSTIMRFVALHEAERHRTGAPSRIPLYLPLRDLTEPCSLLDLARLALREQASIDATEGFESILESGRLLLLLDGLDEVRETLRDKITAEVLRTARSHPKLGMYVGTRQWAYHWRFPGFLHVQVKPFSQRQIHEWLERRFRRTDPRMTMHLVDAFRSDPELGEVGSNPLLLGLLASVFEHTGTVPRKRADLISRYLELILEHWDTYRGVRRSTEYVLKEDKLSALSVIALATWRDSRLSFSETEFCSRQEEWSAAKSQDIARLILRDCGLFTSESEGDRWQFAHETLRNHLAALYLVARPDDVVPYFTQLPLKSEHLNVWRHACGIATDASPLFRAVREHPELPTHERARWLASALGDGANVSSAELREVAREILDALEPAGLEMEITQFDDKWTVYLRSAQNTTDIPRLSALGDVLKILTGGGWTPARINLGVYALDESPRLIKPLMSLLNRSWLVNKMIDLSRRAVILVGVRS